MALRLTLALGIILGCAMCGKAMANGARRRAALLKALLEGLKRLRIRMLEMLEPVRDALRHAENGLLGRVAEGMGDGGSAGEAWERMKRMERRSGGALDALSDADAAMLDRLFECLGESGREEQELLLGGAIQELQILADAARTRVAEADRLYISIGLLTGLMLAIIVV